MLIGSILQDVVQPTTPKEGDLYKEVTISGKTFRLLYGYYESFERESRLNDPIPIYPNFIKAPLYTDEGIPFATAMQNVCAYYKGKNHEDSCCADCVYFQSSEELFGFCICPKNRRTHKEGGD